VSLITIVIGDAMNTASNSNSPLPNELDLILYMLRIKVQSAITSLPDIQQKLLWSVFFDKMSLREAAKKHKIAYTTAWEQHQKALEQLRDELESDWFIKAYREAHDLDD
jgi:DNA-directed RNA polymerase specialized sigma24 family protein